MISEISFLLELLLNHKLSKATKNLIQARIKEVEAIKNVDKYYAPEMDDRKIPGPTYVYRGITAPVLPAIPTIEQPKHVPYEQIAQTPAAQAALIHRAQSIARSEQGLAQPPDPMTGRPRKF